MHHGGLICFSLLSTYILLAIHLVSGYGAPWWTDNKNMDVYVLIVAASISVAHTAVQDTSTNSFLPFPKILSTKSVNLTSTASAVTRQRTIPSGTVY